MRWIRLDMCVLACWVSVFTRSETRIFKYRHQASLGFSVNVIILCWSMFRPYISGLANWLGLV
jgi:hypothetical protein